MFVVHPRLGAFSLALHPAASERWPMLVVLAHQAADLERLRRFGASEALWDAGARASFRGAALESAPEAEYPWRLVVPRAALMQLLLALGADLDYESTHSEAAAAARAEHDPWLAGAAGSPEGGHSPGT